MQDSSFWATERPLEDYFGVSCTGRGSFAAQYLQPHFCDPCDVCLHPLSCSWRKQRWEFNATKIYTSHYHRVHKRQLCCAAVFFVPCTWAWLIHGIIKVSVDSAEIMPTFLFCCFALIWTRCACGKHVNAAALLVKCRQKYKNCRISPCTNVCCFSHTVWSARASFNGSVLLVFPVLQR